MATLWVYAAPLEGASFGPNGRARVVQHACLGVGKVASAVALQGLLRERPDIRRVLCVGVAGAYPPRHRPADSACLAVGDTCVVSSDCLLDEGVETPHGFLGVEAMNLGSRGPFVADPEWSRSLGQRLGVPLVSGATVSTCAGTEALSTARAGSGFRPATESMEGAALSHVCAVEGRLFAQIRTISNLTGDRTRAGFDLDTALASLQTAVERLLPTEAL